LVSGPIPRPDAQPALMAAMKSLRKQEILGIEQIVTDSAIAKV
jgi:hypothetical protein